MPAHQLTRTFPRKIGGLLTPFVLATEATRAMEPTSEKCRLTKKKQHLVDSPGMGCFFLEGGTNYPHSDGNLWPSAGCQRPLRRRLGGGAAAAAGLVVAAAASGRAARARAARLDSEGSNRFRLESAQAGQGRRDVCFWNPKLVQGSETRTHPRNMVSMSDWYEFLLGTL